MYVICALFRGGLPRLDPRLATVFSGSNLRNRDAEKSMTFLVLLLEDGLHLGRLLAVQQCDDDRDLGRREHEESAVCPGVISFNETSRFFACPRTPRGRAAPLGSSFSSPEQDEKRRGSPPGSCALWKSGG